MGKIKKEKDAQHLSIDWKIVITNRMKINSHILSGYSGLEQRLFVG
jgi:hypothetical protein